MLRLGGSEREAGSGCGEAREGEMLRHTYIYTHIIDTCIYIYIHTHVYTYIIHIMVRRETRMKYICVYIYIHVHTHRYT